MGGGEKRDPAEPETSPTPGALTGAGSQDGVGRAGWLDTRAAGPAARLGLCQAFHRAFLPMPLSWGRALCRVRRRVCRWPGGERPLSPPRLWQKETEASWPPLSRAARPGLCGFYRVPAPGHRLELLASWQREFLISCNVS